jgi:hypothetical protein
MNTILDILIYTLSSFVISYYIIVPLLIKLLK